MSTTAGPRIRLARRDDFAAMQAIEVEAGSLFAAIGMEPVADDPPFSIPELAGFTANGLAWVAVDGEDEPVAYLVALRVDGRAHLEQVSVRPAVGRRGIGRALVEHFVSWAADEGLPAVTLTTFRDVPWNAPLYERLGFAVFEVDDQAPGLARIRAAEAAHGLDRWPRVAMIRVIDSRGVAALTTRRRPPGAPQPRSSAS